MIMKRWKIVAAITSCIVIIAVGTGSIVSCAYTNGQTSSANKGSTTNTSSTINTALSARIYFTKNITNDNGSLIVHTIFAANKSVSYALTYNWYKLKQINDTLTQASSDLLNNATLYATTKNENPSENKNTNLGMSSFAYSNKNIYGNSQWFCVVTGYVLSNNKITKLTDLYSNIIEVFMYNDMSNLTTTVTDVPTSSNALTTWTNTYNAYDASLKSDTIKNAIYTNLNSYTLYNSKVSLTVNIGLFKNYSYTYNLIENRKVMNIEITEQNNNYNVSYSVITTYGFEKNFKGINIPNVENFFINIQTYKLSDVSLTPIIISQNNYQYAGFKISSSLDSTYKPMTYITKNIKTNTNNISWVSASYSNSALASALSSNFKTLKYYWNDAEVINTYNNGINYGTNSSN